MRKLLLLVPLMLAACAPTGYYVSDIQPIPGGIAVKKCAFDDRGKATTDDCQIQNIPIGAAPAEVPQAAPPAPAPAPN